MCSASFALVAAMKDEARPNLIRVRSDRSIVGTAVIASITTLAVALFLQWLVYNDLLHRTGPLRVVGSAVAAFLAFSFVVRVQFAQRQRRMEVLRRFETIAEMNDRIRNALQVIECATYATNPEATKPVREAVDTIEAVLDEVVIKSHPLVASESENESLPKFVKKKASNQ